MHLPVHPRIENVDPIVSDILKGMSVAERVALVEDSNQVARLLIAGGVRYRHPDWSDAQIETEVVRRMLRDAN